MPMHTRIRVHFPSELATPPADRTRKMGVVYPKVAQSKDTSDRRCCDDLFWGRGSVASPSHTLSATLDGASDNSEHTLDGSTLSEHAELQVTEPAETPRPRAHRRFSFVKTLAAIDQYIGKQQSTLAPLPPMPHLTPKLPPWRPTRMGDPDLPTPPLVTPTSSQSSEGSTPDSDQDSFMRPRDAPNDVYIHIHSRSDESDINVSF
ncbi:hypothetical protein FA95DRAFT_1601889 [Auriscalpium vulgare]|uniref:Uncharacterized protein n=1 Tax=Auriscalpium vulgare TaxID=40419 RepID=A0ACB8S9B1_9AGAM|nr:hypothetical protein FA95DRAFT_1601889 [Auriscalpium vulgare]